MEAGPIFLTNREIQVSALKDNNLVKWMNGQNWWRCQMYMYIYYFSFLYVPFHALYCIAQFPLYCGNTTQQVRNPCPGVAWHYTKWRRSRSAPPLGRAEMRLYLSWHLESRWKTQWWTETVGAGRLRWRCGAAWDSLEGWQGSARPISSWQLHRLENHQMSSAIRIWMAAVTVERLCVALERFSVCVCVCAEFN